MQHFSISPREMVASFWRNRNLILSLTKREVIGRYRGSLMGMAWSLFNPILMLWIYTFVFSEVFKARWSIGSEESKFDFAIILFVGMIIHGLFSECLNRAPGLILANANYVKKVVFPLEILPWVALSSSLFHSGVSLIVLLAAQLILTQDIAWTVVLFPLVLIPLILGTMGFAWFLAGLGVYIRDIGQITGMLTTILMFLSPVFYPISALPPQYQNWLKINPLTFIIEESRNTLIFGKCPDLWQLSFMSALGVIIAWAGFIWFQKIRKGFADVL